VAGRFPVWASAGCIGFVFYPRPDFKLIDGGWRGCEHFRGVVSMLETIAVILIILWLVGLVTSTTMGGLIHILLVIAIVVILLRVIRR